VRVPELEENMRDVLVVSPHLDDAVLSAGGRIAHLATAGARVCVFTVFAGVPAPPYSSVARAFHRSWGLDDDAVHHRREEDRRAINHLMARAVHGDYPDAIYRTDSSGRWLISNGSQPTRQIAEDEAELTRTITVTVRDLIDSLRPDLVLTCASVGDHIDHRHTCDAVRAAATTSGVTLRVWTDQPYSSWTDEPYSPQTLGALPDSLSTRIGVHRPEAFWVDQDAWAKKMAAIDEYKSQHSALWPGVADFHAVVNDQARDLAEALGGSGRCELYWQPAGS
jgi:LmbE family N-acetylglucosaminyl deacetylase